MVCAYCGSAAHMMGYKDCPNDCTVYAARQDTIAIRTRVRTGHMARQCTFCDTCQTNRAKNKCPNQRCAYCEEYGHAISDAKRCPEKPTPLCYACGSSTHQTPRSVDCSDKCATCQGEPEPKGHSHKNCQLAQCDACNLGGHIADVCSFRQRYDVEVDYYLNLLLLTKGRHTIESYFDGNPKWSSIQPNALGDTGTHTGLEWQRRMRR
jgi:hypothetical protein